MAKSDKKDTKKQATAVKDGGVKKPVNKRAGKNVQASTDEIDDIFNKKKITDTSEIDDIFNSKSLGEDKKKVKEPVLSKSAKRKAAKKGKKVVEEEDKDMEEEEEEEEQQEELTEEQSKKVEEVVFAELIAVKNSKTPTKRALPPPTADDDFGDSKGLKKTTRTTDDGYPLYDVKDLNIGNGLDTPECPFDCKCCY